LAALRLTPLRKLTRSSIGEWIDVFWTLAVIGALMIPLALIIKPIDLHAPAEGH
jgi:hypothetical protein